MKEFYNGRKSMVGKFMAAMMELLVFFLLIAKVQADDYHLTPTTSFQYSVNHFIVGHGRNYNPGPFYYCLTKIERCGNPRKKWLPMLGNIDNEKCIVNSFPSCMSRLPIEHDRAFRAAEWCLHDCSILTNIEGRNYPPCLLRCYLQRIKLQD